MWNFFFVEDMKKYKPQDKQRFHRNRDVLVPHGFISGILLSINPLQESRALREGEIYFNALTEDLQAGQGSSSTKNNESNGSKATSALLAAELENAVKEDQASRKRKRDDENSAKATWFSSIDICCKGFLLLRIPMINSNITCTTIAAYGPNGDSVSTSSNTAEECSSNHSITINPLVSHVAERVFRDLKDNPRPVFRHCFRLIPVEVTCCPVLLEMKLALQLLLKKHFSDDKNENEFRGKLDEPFSCSRSFSRQRSLITVFFSLTIKNNTKVQANQREISEGLLQLFPLNKFTVVLRENGEIEAAVRVIVAQSTCLMGVQRCYSERSHFNIAEISRKAFPVDRMLKEHE